jgi:hypothetical protein
MRPDLAGAHPGDERQPAGFATRVESLHQRNGVVGGHLRAELHGDRITDLTAELDVRTIRIPGPLTDPQQMGGQVIRKAGAAVDPGQRPLVVEQERLVARVELHPMELLRVSAAGLHERKRAIDLAGELLVALPGRALRHEVLIPGVRLVEVGVPAACERPAHVQSPSRAVVRLEQPRRIGSPRLGCELEVVHSIAAIGREFNAVSGLGGAGSGLCELPRHPADLHNRDGRCVRQHERHLKQRLDLRPHRVNPRPREGLRAIASLQDERLARGDCSQPLRELVALARKDEGRLFCQFSGDISNARGVWPFRLLGGGKFAPGIEVDRLGGRAHESKTRPLRGRPW